MVPLSRPRQRRCGAGKRRSTHRVADAALPGAGHGDADFRKEVPARLRGRLKPWVGEVFDTAYIPNRAQRRHRLASPAWRENADDIAGIAPALIITAEHDRLRDEAKRYADKLAAAGSLAEYYEVRSVDHGYNIMTDARDLTRQTYRRIADHVSQAISTT
jgi:acetyl esterase